MNATTTNIDPLDRLTGDHQTAVELAQATIAAIKQARESQPERLAKARAEAATARDWAQIEEPFSQFVTALRAHTADGGPTSTTIALPSMQAKVLYGVRLAFDALDAGEDPDLLDEVKSRYFTMTGGDTGLAFLIFAEALDTIAGIVVPQLLDDLERHGQNYDARVLLAEACTKAWSDRVARHTPATEGESFND